MAKEKAPLTPEEQEIKAIKKVKRGQNTTKFFAILLALVLTVGVVFAGKTVAEKASPAVKTEEQDKDANANNDANASEDEEDPFAEDSNSGSGSGETADKPADNKTDADKPADKNDKPADDKKDPNAPAKGSKEESKMFLDVVNKATQEAEKCNNYHWDRKCNGSLQMPSGVSKLDPIVAKFAGGMTITQVVENFLGFSKDGYKFDIDRAAIKENKDNLRGTMLPNGAYFYDRYLFVGTELGTSDIKAPVTLEGSEYTIKIKNCKNPGGDKGSNPLRRATTDFVYAADVNQNLQDSTGKMLKLKEANVEYKNIVVKATVEDGKLQKLTLSYDMDVTQFDINMLSGSTGKGSVTVTYSDFK